MAGPVLCSSSNGNIVVTADLGGEGALENLQVSVEGSVRQPELKAGSFFRDREFSFESIVPMEEESILFDLKTRSVRGNLLKGTLTESAGESQVSYRVNCIVVYPAQEASN